MLSLLFVASHLRDLTVFLQKPIPKVSNEFINLKKNSLRQKAFIAYASTNYVEK